MTNKTAVMGAAGFAGIELVRLLLQHPDFELCIATSDANVGRSISDMYPSFAGKTDLAFSTSDDPTIAQMDVVFLAVPHTVALKHAPKLVEAGVVVIDLSADFRLKDANVYEAYYDTPHTQRDLLAQAAFGQPELFMDGLVEVASRHEAGLGVLVACAGCYPTATSLAAAPAIRAQLIAPNSIVVADAISGVTGAGKKPSERTHFCFANDNLEAYGVGKHRHTPEIEQILGIEGRLVFTPHLAPLNRGILSTVTLQFAEGKSCSTTQLVDMYKDFYKGSSFVEVLPEGQQPKTSSVAGTNNAQIGIVSNERTHTIIATCAIDNLCKGAAGQAVQCANIVFGFPEDAGLKSLALPI